VPCTARPVSLACWAHSGRSEIDTLPSGSTAASYDSLMISLSVDVARDPEFQHPGFLLAGDVNRLRP
jgi:hypothetical protein